MAPEPRTGRRKRRGRGTTAAEAARIAGLSGLEIPTLEAVERRRVQLWVLTAFVLVLLASAAVLLATFPVQRFFSWLTPQLLHVSLLAIVTLFAAYALEKEMQLNRLTHLLVREKVLTASLTGRLEELEALLAAGRAVNLDLDLEQVLHRILESVQELLQARDASVMLLHAGHDLRTVSVVGNSAASGARMEVGQGIAGKVAESKEPLLIAGTVDRSGDPLAKDAPPPSSAMCVPLIHREAVLGVLNVNALPGRTYDHHDLRALAIFGEHAATALGNAQVYETQRMASSRSFYHSLHDGLTGLPNRALFFDRVQHALAQRREENQLVAVVFLDLDEFKKVNDSLGHAAGDEVLVNFADRLRAAVRTADTVARFGGDEFAVLVEHVESPGEAMGAARRITHDVDRPFQLGDRRIVLGCSLGVAVEHRGHTTAEELVRNADTALHAVKRGGESKIQLFEETMFAEARERLDLESDLRQALEREQIEVHLQPIFELSDRRPIGLEALVRWQHPRQGLLPASQFVPLAQAAGLMEEIDRFVLTWASRTLNSFDGDAADLDLYVNVPPNRLHDRRVAAEVEAILSESGLDPRRLVLEVTESSMMHDPERAARTLHEIKAIGARIAVDDFGTGYSSLSHFRRFPVDAVKIDRMFVDGLARASGEESLVKAIVRLGHSLALEVIAEGLEEEMQVDYLREVGCHLGQGYLLARPLSPAQVGGFVGGLNRPPLF